MDFLTDMILGSLPTWLQWVLTVMIAVLLIALFWYAWSEGLG
jgi:hypothetical protein